MRLKAIWLIGAVLLVSACGQDKATDTGSGTGAATQPPANPETVTPAPVTPVASLGPLPGSQNEFVAEIGDRVYFAFDRADLDADAQATLDRQAAWLQQYRDVTVTIQGHCDERGTREYNLALGERRANGVRDYLIASGVDPSRLAIISYGKERPVAFGSDEDSWGQNRRGVTVIN